jgi:hypothetical protein
MSIINYILRYSICQAPETMLNVVVIIVKRNKVADIVSNHHILGKNCYNCLKLTDRLK